MGKKINNLDKEQSSHVRKHTVYKKTLPHSKKKPQSCLQSSQTQCNVN